MGLRSKLERFHFVARENHLCAHWPELECRRIGSVPCSTRYNTFFPLSRSLFHSKTKDEGREPRRKASAFAVVRTDPRVINTSSRDFSFVSFGLLPFCDFKHFSFDKYMRGDGFKNSLYSLSCLNVQKCNKFISFSRCAKTRTETLEEKKNGKDEKSFVEPVFTIGVSRSFAKGSLLYNGSPLERQDGAR